MKKIPLLLSFVMLFLLTNCDSVGSLDSSVDSSEALGDGVGGGQNGQSGLITAGEWNDLDNWQFWNDLLGGENYADKPSHWDFYTNNRISILITDNSQPIFDVQIELLNTSGAVVWESRSDNSGKAELWIDLYEENQSVNISEYSLRVNGQVVSTPLRLYSEGINEIQLSLTPSVSNRVELSFIVDATGSMGDELEFLKDDLDDVIRRVKDNNSSLDIFTSSVFYRDEEDDYLVRSSDFTNDINTTLEFINQQSAAGGGDFPEAVHTALKRGIEQLQWSENAKTRIAFLLLDAPPHYTPQIIDQIQNSIKEAAKKGIKIVPISASGIDKNTEFLLRFFSISTNGTYVFVTDDSGIGNDHLEPSVGQYEVEFLNDLMVRLINEYSQ